MNRLVLMILKNILKFPAAYSKLCRYAKNPDKYSEAETYGHIRYMLQEAVKAGNVDVQVHGKENFPKENGFMIYGNHQGLFDAVALVVSCEVPLGTVFKHELKDVPLLREIVACTKSFALDRENVRQSLEVIQNVTNEVTKGRNYVVFPEGTRSKKGNEMLPFHGGSFKSAIKAKCPILPVAFIDSFKVLDQKGSAPVTMHIYYLQPIPYEEYQGMKAVEVAELVRSRIAEAIANHFAQNDN